MRKNMLMSAAQVAACQSEGILVEQGRRKEVWEGNVALPEATGRGSPAGRPGPGGILCDLVFSDRGKGSWGLQGAPE